MIEAILFILWFYLLATGEVILAWIPFAVALAMIMGDFDLKKIIRK